MSDDAKDWLVGILSFGVIIVGFVVYLLPGIVAAARRHPKVHVIGSANFLLAGLPFLIWFGSEARDRDPTDLQVVLGGTIVFWFGLLIWAFRRFEKPKKSE